MIAVLPKALADVFRALPAIAIAFSGGLDSRFLAFAAMQAGKAPLLLHISGPHVPDRESEYAKDWAYAHSCNYVDICLNPLDIYEVRHNGADRCYGCKKYSFVALQDYLRAREDGPWTLCDGSQMDDLAANRPGNRAVLETATISPLARARLGKQDVRALAQSLGLDRPRQLPAPCLLTRLPYGMEASTEILTRIERCEREIGALAAEEEDFRLRAGERPVLQWSGTIGSRAEKIRDILAKYDFRNVEFIEGENVSGYFDRLSHLKRQ